MALMISWSSTVFLSLSLILTIIPNSASKPTYLYSFCPNTTTFTSNSHYHDNLNALFHSLSSNATTSSSSGFYAASIGTTTTAAVYGLFLCRGDQNAISCADCVSTTTASDLPKTYCRNGKTAVIWYDECMVRYSNESFFGRMDQSPKVYRQDTRNITGNQTRFMEVLGEMMNDVAIEASRGGSEKKFSTQVADWSGSERLYGLGQCTPDLMASDCNECLRIAIGGLPLRMGGSVLQPSCFVEYATYPFFNEVAKTNNSANPKSGPKGKKESGKKIIIPIVVPVAVIAVALLIAGFYIIQNRVKKHHAFGTGPDEEFTASDSLQYKLSTILLATKNFLDDNKLGEGGFGTVFKGTLMDGREIAVKRLSSTSIQGIQEFKNEILLLAKLHHRNLVRLLGFCLEGKEKLLIYEHVPNKSLDYFLSDPVKQGHLNWRLRYTIIQGIARAVLYLHEDSRLRIIHRDLKASNVLLDIEMNPKVSDFGMARIFNVDQTRDNTSRIVGTYGYMSPEYAMHGEFSIKSDVYSYGVLVLEIISGKRNSNFYQTGHSEDLLSYAWRQWNDGTPLEFADQLIRNSCSSDEVMKCLQLGLLCVQHYPDKRPTMGVVVQTLDSRSTALPMPERPAFIIEDRGKLGSSKDLIGLSQSTIKSMPYSVNDAPITEVEPR